MTKNHIFILTGASKGLGAQLAKQLLQSEENHVYCLSRTENADIKRSAPRRRYHYFSVDLTHPGLFSFTLQDIFASIDPRAVGSITLINNAASAAPFKEIHEFSQEEIMSSIQLNLTTPILLSSALIRIASEWEVPKNIVNISSGSAEHPAQGMSLYGPAKSALNLFSAAVALEQAGKPNPVRMYAVDPGMMDTGMQRTARESEFALSEFFARQKADHKLSDPADVARKIIGLLRSPAGPNGGVYRL